MLMRTSFCLLFSFLFFLVPVEVRLRARTGNEEYDENGSRDDNNLDAKASPCSCRSEDRKNERVNQMSEHTQEKATVEEKMVGKEKEKREFLRGRVATSRGPGRA
jgi:hypothetical protein